MYQDLTLRLKKHAMLQKDPIAIYLSKKPPEEMEKVEGTIAFCKMLDITREKQAAIYASADNLGGCEQAIQILGLGEIDRAVARGDMDVEEHGVSPSLRIARRIFSDRYTLEPNSINYVAVSPLEKAQSEPDVVLVQGKPGSAQRLVYAYMNFSGHRPLGLAGNSFCSSCIAAPYLTGEMTYGLGMHYFGGPPYAMRYTMDEMFVGIPGELVKPIVEQLISQTERLAKMAPQFVARAREKEKSRTRDNGNISSNK